MSCHAVQFTWDRVTSGADGDMHVGMSKGYICVYAANAMPKFEAKTTCSAIMAYTNKTYNSQYNF